MSNWQPAPPSGDFSRFSGYQFEPPKPPRRGVGLLVLVFGGLIVAAGAGVAGLAAFFAEGFLDGVRDDDDIVGAAQWAAPETVEDRHRDIVAGFGAKNSGAPRAVRRSLEAFLDELVEACREGDQGRFSALLDGERMVEQFKRHPESPPLSYFEERTLPDRLVEKCGPPADWVRYSLVHVDLAPSEPEAKLYVVLWDESNEAFEYRLWLVRRGGGWRMYDWDFCQFDGGFVQHWVDVALHSDTADYQAYKAGNRDIDAAEEHRLAGEREAAEECFARAEGRRVSGDYYDKYMLDLGYASFRLGKTADALARCRQVSNGKALPGAYYARALARNHFRQHRRALELTGRYEQVIGGGPNVCWLKAESLTALGRLDEAAAEWRRLLSYDPEDQQNLRSYADVLAAEQADALVQQIRRAAAPLDSAEALLPSLQYRGDNALLVAVAGLVAELAPESALRRHADALVLQQRQKYDEAAAIYLDLYRQEEAEDERSRWLYRFFDCRLSQERFYDLYAESPDPEEAFIYLTDIYDEGDYDLPREEFARILAAHHKQHPGAPWLAYYEAGMLIDEEKLDEAIRVVKEALKTAEDEFEQELLRERLADAMTEAGNALEAYGAIEPRDEAFRQIAQNLQTQQDAEMLRKLAALRRKDAPQDPWLGFYLGVASRIDEDYAEAERLLAIAAEQAGEEETLVYRCTSERIDIAMAQGGVVELYERLSDPESQFEAVARRLLSDDRLDELSKLLDSQRRRHPDLASLAYYDAQLGWRRRDYAGVVRRCADSLERGGSFEDTWQTRQTAETLVRCLLRLGDIDRAGRIARRLDDEYGVMLPWLLVAAKTQDVETVEAAIEEYAAATSGHAMRSLYFDEEVGDVLRGEAYRDVRRRFPGSLSVDAGGTQIVMLLARPATWDADSLAQDLGEALPARFEVVPLPSVDDRPHERSLVIVTGGDRVAVTMSPAPYSPRETIEQLALHDASLVASLGRHAAWLSVTALDRGESQDATKSVQRVAAALLPRVESEGVYFEPAYAILSGERAAAALQQDDVDEYVEREGDDCFLYRDADWDAAFDARERAQQSLDEFRAAFRDRSEAGEYVVRVSTSLGDATEVLDVKLDRLERETGGRWRYVGTLLADSRLDPRYERGDPVAVAEYEVYDWRYRDDSSAAQGRDATPEHTPVTPTDSP